MKIHIDVDPLAKPKVVLDTSMAGRSADALAAMPRSRSVVRNIQKWKETKLFKVPDAKKTDEIDIQV
jgi:hypothetical protein